jgi:hypothetical protein
MHSEHRFAELSESLKNGFLLDDIVLALARAERGQPLSEKDRKVLNKAVFILERAEEGYHWLDKPELNSQTQSAATFFSRAVNALPAVDASDAFLERISNLKTTAALLSNGQPTQPEKIGLLRLFFYNTAQSELGRTDQLLSGEGTADVLKWAVTKE